MYEKDCCFIAAGVSAGGVWKKTAMFIVDNQSDWRVVVSITNVKKVDKSLYTIFKRNDPYSNTPHIQTALFLKSMRKVSAN